MKTLARKLVLLLPLLVPFASAAQGAGEMPVTTSSKEARALFDRGRDHFDNVEGALAAPLFDEAIRKDEGFALARAYRALSGGPLEQGREQVDRAMALADAVSPGERLWIQGARAIVYGDAKALIASDDALLAMFPKDKRILLGAGLHQQGAGDWRRAADYFKKAASIDPSFAPAQNSLAYAHLALGDLPAAEKAVRRYVELRPGSPNAHDSLGEILLKQGRFDDAIASYRKALAIDPSFSSSWDGIGHCQVLLGRYVEGRDAYARSAAVATDLNGRISARFWRTVSYVHEGRTGEAIGSFDELRAFADANGAPGTAVWTHLHSAWILIEKDSLGAAAAQVDAAKARMSNPSIPPGARAGMELGAQRLQVMSLARIHAFDEARALAAKGQATAAALKDEGAQRWGEGIQAWAELEAGRPDAALDHAARSMTDNAYILYIQASAHELKGQAAEARKGFAQLARWNQNDLGYALVRARALARAGASQ